MNNDTISLHKSRLIGGVWEGVLHGAGEMEPQLQVTHLGEPIAGLTSTYDAATGDWHIRVPIPADRIADGVQTFLISEVETGTQLTSFALLAGEALSEDFRSEVNLLREELDMLKKAFRRHCLETM